ncbi:MAG: MinD/ParA family protein, partial [Gammaproteobacteria bacterium]|nr:MinD/ParA family protein [Gammaproteobacteria bacterium]
ELVATIPFDENVRKAARKQKAFVEAFPKTPASLAVKTLATRAVQWPVPPSASGHLEFFLEQLVHSKIEARGLA